VVLPTSTEKLLTIPDELVTGEGPFTVKEGIGKILYGSDFPNGDPKEMVAGFKALQIGEEFRGRFLGDNARRLLGL
jgi:predicted TIM-barrel fold metal-dependent hydrolase